MDREMERLIPSKDVRELIEKTGRTFTDFEIAVLLYNSTLAYDDKVVLMKELLEKTEDIELKQMLKERIDQNEEDIKCFNENANAYVYVLKSDEYEVEEGYCGHFTNAKVAYKYGLKLAHSFRIEKYALMDSGEDVSFKRTFYSNPYIFVEKNTDELIEEYESNLEEPVAIFFYSQEGKLEYFNGSEVIREEKEELDKMFNPKRFENAYIEIPNPFDAGDIVRLVTDGGHGIVATSSSEWEEYKKRLKNVKEKDFVDTGITVDFILDDGEMIHNHINPIFLEKYAPAEDDADKEVLLAASNVYRGVGLDSFIYCYDEYRKNGKK